MLRLSYPGPGSCARGHMIPERRFILLAYAPSLRDNAAGLPHRRISRHRSGLETNLSKKSVNARAAAGSTLPSPLPLWSRPGYLVRRLHQIHSALFAEECKKFNLTPVQYGLLTVLRHHPGSDQVTIGKEVGIDRTNAAEVLAGRAAGLGFRLVEQVLRRARDDLGIIRHELAALDEADEGRLQLLG